MIVHKIPSLVSTQKYLDQHGRRCPLCRSGTLSSQIIRAGDTDDYGMLDVRSACFDCEFVFHEVIALNGYGSIDPSGEREVVDGVNTFVENKSRVCPVCHYSISPALLSRYASETMPLSKMKRCIGCRSKWVTLFSLVGYYAYINGNPSVPGDAPAEVLEFLKRHARCQYEEAEVC